MLCCASHSVYVSAISAPLCRLLEKFARQMTTLSSWNAAFCGGRREVADEIYILYAYNIYI